MNLTDILKALDVIDNEVAQGHIIVAGQLIHDLRVRLEITSKLGFEVMLTERSWLERK